MGRGDRVSSGRRGRRLPARPGAPTTSAGRTRVTLRGRPGVVDAASAQRGKRTGTSNRFRAAGVQDRCGATRRCRAGAWIGVRRQAVRCDRRVLGDSHVASPVTLYVRAILVPHPSRYRRGGRTPRTTVTRSGSAPRTVARTANACRSRRSATSRAATRAAEAAAVATAPGTPSGTAEAEATIPRRMTTVASIQLGLRRWNSIRHPRFHRARSPVAPGAPG